MNLIPKLSRLAPALAAAVFIGLAPAAVLAQAAAPAATDAPAAARCRSRRGAHAFGKAAAARDAFVRGGQRRRP